MIKPKIGECKDCGHSGPLTAGRCQRCYWPYRAKEKSKTVVARAKANEVKKQKDQLSYWFDVKIKMRPAGCEACGTHLGESMIANPRTIVAHIVPKSKVPEVGTHPLNYAYLCSKCHYRYDNGFVHLLPTPVLQTMVNRFLQFKKGIQQEHYQYIPEFLKQHL